MSLLDRFFQIREENDDPKPFLQHLEELRVMLIKMALVLCLAMIFSFVFREEMAAVLQAPLREVSPEMASRLATLGVIDSLTISFTLAFNAGLTISFPFLAFFFAQFVVPALTKKEKRFIFPAIGVSFTLFLIGVSACYYLILPETLKFFYEDAQKMGFTPTWTVREYFSFTTRMILGFGLAFQLPIGVMALVSMGLLSFKFLNDTRRYAIVIILALALILAPTPDIFTFLSLGIPMCLMYEACIWMAWLIEKRRRERLALEEAAEAAEAAKAESSTEILPPNP